jgi:DNA-binding IclR family transcriptional regulator
MTPDEFTDTVRTETVNVRLVLRAIPQMPEVASAALIAQRLPYLSRSTVDRILRGLRSRVMVYETDRGRLYSRYLPESVY